MPQLLCHLIGDYCLQNHWMAINKTRSSLVCLVHVLLYTLPFLLLTTSPLSLGIIAGTHFIIDRFALASYWVEWWGVGCSGRLWVPKSTRAVVGYDLFDLSPRTTEGPNPAWEEAPDWLAVWLRIIVDNTWHLAINFAALSL